MTNRRTRIERLLDIDLTSKQKKALPAFTWLTSNDNSNRVTGRTFVLAVAFIATALKKRDCWVSVYDHTTLYVRRDTVLQIVHGLLYRNKKLYAQAEFKSTSSMFRIRRNFDTKIKSKSTEDTQRRLTHRDVVEAQEEILRERWVDSSI